MKAAPFVPEAVVALLITGVGALIVKARVAEPVPLGLIAPKVTVDVPVAVGVPVMAPVEVLIDNPAGNPVALKVTGLLFAVIV